MTKEKDWPFGVWSNVDYELLSFWTYSEKSALLFSFFAAIKYSKKQTFFQFLCIIFREYKMNNIFSQKRFCTEIVGMFCPGAFIDI